MDNRAPFDWKPFRLYEVFEKVETKTVQGKASDFPASPTGEYVIPLLTAGIEHQGLSRYARREQCHSILRNVISISANGTNTGSSFYQDEEFAILQDAYAVDWKDGGIPSRGTGLFLAACLNKLLHGQYDWSNKARWNAIRSLIMYLPVTDAGVPDTNYMKIYMDGIEKAQASKLEQYFGSIARGIL